MPKAAFPPAPAPPPRRRTSLLAELVTPPNAVLLLALTLFFALAATVIVAVQRISTTAPRVKATKAQLATIDVALSTFEVNNGRYPTASEGLHALVPAMIEQMPVDPWNHPYIYAPLPSTTRPYALRSAGPDGIPNTPDDIVFR